MAARNARSFVYSAGRSIDEVKRLYGLKRVVKLASNENNWGLPARIVRRFCGFLRESHRYPDSAYTELRQSIARRFGVDASTVVTGNGSDEVLDILLERLTGPSDQVLIPAPSYQLYRILLNNAGRRFREIPLKGWGYDLGRFLKAVTPRTRVIVLCNPNNPTGAYIPAGGMTEFLRRLPRRVWVVVDEAYADFADAGDFASCIGLREKFPNVIVCRTFSKLYCFAGLRLGFAFVPPKVAAIYDRFRPPFSMNILAERSGFLLDERRFFDRLTGRILAEKEAMYARLSALGVEYVRTQTNFVFLPGLADSVGVFEALLRKGIVVRELSSFGIRGGLRVTVGKPAENRLFFSALASVPGVVHARP